MKSEVQPQRMSVQRQVILEELRKVNSHPTADELFQIVRLRLPRISLGTVYRNLERLSNAGEVRKLKTLGNQARFDGDMHSHYHLHCTQCGALADVEGVAYKPPLAKTAAATGYVVEDYILEFRGICPECQL